MKLTRKLEAENKKLRDAVRRRTEELKQKSRELEIETALEKVRSVAMGMKEAADMLKICKTISQQLAKLGVNEIRNVQTAIFYEDRQVYMNYEYYAKHDKTFITETSYTNHRIHKAFARKMLKGKGQFYKTHIKGKKVKDWIAYQKTTNVFIDKYLNTASSLNYYWHSLGPVALGISTYAPLTKESSELFLRFLKVFELAYRRYLDIEKAEAQAREAQIEAALERVRAGAMAMHSSNELNEVVHELRKQMGLLGQKGLETCVIHLHDESPDFIHSWAAIKPPGTESVILESKINVPKNGLLIIEEAMEAYDSNRQDYIIINEGKKLKQWFSFLKKESPIGYNKLMKSVRGDIRKLRAFWSFADFAGGSLIMVTMDEPDGPTRTMLRRFANVFGLAYRRFADLKQAEAQAREAQIEAALERVRSRSMAMHKSDELKEVIRLVLEQFIHLNIKAEHAGFYIDYKAHDDMHIWLADPNIEPFYAVIPYFDTPTWNSFLEAKAKGITLHTDLLDFKTKNKFYRSLFKLFPVPEEAKKFYLACKGLAVSTVLLDSVGLYIENFDGTPYTDEENNILLRFGKVFQQTYTRFLDLQKAETQAREAQTEAALEKVRSRSLAMHKSDELLEVVAIIFEQLKKLGLQLWNCAIIRFQSKQSYEGEIWMSRPDGKMMQQSFIIPMDKVPVYKKLYDAWRDKKEFHVEFLQDMEIVKHHNRIASLNIFPIDKIKQAAGRELPRQMFFHSINFSDGILGVITTEAVGDETLLLRFGNTFKQAYTRYLDLQKAETQAKEAQIEAALERVRSRTMAMHQSRELNEAAELLYQELSKLGIEKLTCGFTLLDDKTGLGTCYMANPEGSFVWEPFRLNHTGSPVFNLMYKSWKKQEPYLLYELAGQVNIDHNKYLAETADNFPIPSEQLLAILPPVTFSNSFNFRYGYLLVVSLAAFTKEHCSIISRFAKVFEQTYTRFLDLQKAEAQARQAKIETALEKVRARALAMQQPEELTEVAQVMRYEMGLLGVEELETSSIYIHEENSDKAECWYAIKDIRIPEKKLVADHFILNLNDTWVGLQMFAFYQSSEKQVSIPMQGANRKEWINYCSRQSKLLQGFYGDTIPDRTYHLYKFSNGTIGAATPGNISTESWELLQRAASAFSLAYSRFKDLTQARIDLQRLKEEKQRAETALSELQTTQKQLIQAEKMASLGELTAGIAHEIQNPLNFVNNFSEVSKELLDEMKEAIEKGDTEDAKEIMNDVIQNLEKINHHGKRADGIVKGMLQHSRSSSGQKESTDINALCDEYLRLSYHGLRAKDKSFNAKFETHLDETVGKLHVIPQDIGRVVLNLFNNAFYAVSERKKLNEPGYEPTVSVSTFKDGDSIKIKVSDNGTGIPQKVLDKIFQPFFTTKPTGQGTGLGLSLSYDIITKGHGGELKVETKEGEGCEFTITLPA
jgi:signal transduction histidine kinase